MTQIMANVMQSIGLGPLSGDSVDDSVLDAVQQLMLQMIELKLEPSELAEAVLLVSNATRVNRSKRYPWTIGGIEVNLDDIEIKKLADLIMQSIMSRPAVLEPHIGALIDWCLKYSQIADKINLLQQLPTAAFAAHAPKLVTLACQCTGYGLADVSFKLCLDKLEPPVRAAAIGAELKQRSWGGDQQQVLVLLVSLLRGIGIDELLPLTDDFERLLGESCSVAVGASELLCTLPDVAVAPHILGMTALLMKLDDDIDDGGGGGGGGGGGDDEAGALRLAKALASLSPALLYTHAEAFVGVRLLHPVTQVRTAAAEIVARAAQSIDA
jgi:hypothetical protein